MMHLESYLYIFFDIAILLLRKLPFFDLMHLGDHFFLLPALKRMTFNFFPVWFERFFPCQTISIDIIQTCIVLCLVKWCKMHQNCTSTMSNIGRRLCLVLKRRSPYLELKKSRFVFELVGRCDELNAASQSDFFPSVCTAQYLLCCNFAVKMKFFPCRNIFPLCKLKVSQAYYHVCCI